MSSAPCPTSLNPVPPAVRRQLLESARASDARHEDHARFFDELPAFHTIAWQPPATVRSDRPSHLRVAAWNIQHGHFPEPAAALLARHAFDAVLLTELDIGMLRTSQQHVPARLAAAQGHGHAFGLEFLELTATPGPETHPSASDENHLGFHGNGLTTALPPTGFALIHLPEEANWYNQPRRGQYRIGKRVAVAARVPLADGEVVLVSVHLESDTDAAGRGRQMAHLLQAVDTFAGADPVLIGGDFNAGARTPDFDYRGEALFQVAQAHHYEWEAFNRPGPTSRPSRVTNAVQQDRARYDWFFGRGLQAEDPTILPALSAAGPLSDHDLIAVTIRLATRQTLS